MSLHDEVERKWNKHQPQEQHWRKGTRELCKAIQDLDYQTGMVDVYYAIGVADIKLLVERACNICSSLSGSTPIANSKLEHVSYLSTSIDTENGDDVMMLWSKLLSASDDIGWGEVLA